MDCEASSYSSRVCLHQRWIPPKPVAEASRWTPLACHPRAGWELVLSFQLNGWGPLLVLASHMPQKQASAP